MARYELPPDPRERFTPARKRRLGVAQSIDWIAIVGLLLGLVITLLAILIAWQAATSFLEREPLDVTPITEPTIVVLTAPPTTQAVANDEPPLPAIVVATATPEDAEKAIDVGVYTAVANTEGVGVTVRGGPSTDNVRLLLLDEGDGGLVVGGPQEANGFTWWQLRLDDGTEGWVAADFLETATTPEQ